MNRLVATAVIKLCGEAIFITVLAGIIIGIIGYVNKWNTSRQYSDALFIAACLIFSTGALSRRLAGEEWGYFRGIYAESFRQMSPSERANFIVNASNSIRLTVLGLLSGILLTLLSLLVIKLF